MTTPDKTPGLVARLFDIRSVIGALLGIYGILLTLAGLFPSVFGNETHSSPSNNVVDMSVGTSANLWVGLIMLAIALTFGGWAIARPAVVGDAKE
ncbi:hypothetical protein [Rhodococcoides kyotonense]|uniref:Uncharacterized protein n=1 Tax=Rhodococcoides kyotonense TaxID=398843 RepID=A0A239IYY3_9NOCA|nr:hypothetical protein [Rhodococcus kyotonensis]SNS97634.1 hypothetical protein SAMN05421642_107249 [Rhodococcus kyotonensis]